MMDDESTLKTRMVFGASIAATILGLVIVIDPASLVQYVGWEEDAPSSIYARGMVALCAGCFFGLRSWRTLTAIIARRSQSERKARP